jgi:hypothetical protein
MKIKPKIFFHDLGINMPSREWTEKYFGMFRNTVTPVILDPNYNARDYFSEKLLMELHHYNHEMYLSAKINAATYGHLIIFEKIMDLYSKASKLSGILLFEFLKKLVSASLTIEEEMAIKTIFESNEHPQIRIERMNIYFMKLVFNADVKFFRIFEDKLNSMKTNISNLKTNEMLEAVFSKSFEKTDLSKLLIFLVRGLKNPDFIKQLIIYSLIAYKEKLEILLSESTSYKKWIYNIGELFPFTSLIGLVPDKRLHIPLFNPEELDLIKKEDKIISELDANLFSIIVSLELGLIEPNFTSFIKKLKEKKTKFEQKKQLIFYYRNKLTIPKYLYDELLDLLPIK